MACVCGDFLVLDTARGGNIAHTLEEQRIADTTIFLPLIAPLGERRR